MSVTLEVSKLSGWLKADAVCRVEGRACDAGGRGASREAGAPGVWWWHDKRHARGRKGPTQGLGAKGTREAHVEHVAHFRDVSLCGCCTSLEYGFLVRVQYIRHGSTTVSTHSHPSVHERASKELARRPRHMHTHTTSRCSTSVSRRGSVLSPLGRVLRLSLAACQRPPPAPPFHLPSIPSRSLFACTQSISYSLLPSARRR